MSPSRREFLRRAGAGALGGLALGSLPSSCAPTPAAPPPTPTPSPGPFSLSLAEWSLHRTIRSGALDPLDFAPHARARFGFDAVEHVNQFFIDRGTDDDYLREMRRRADDAGVRSLLIMCDLEGALGDPDTDARFRAVENHYKWVEAASVLGCHAIRVNADSAGGFDEQQRLAADGIWRLAHFADAYGIDVLVENHEGLSNHGAWLAGLIRRIDHPRVGALTDFGNWEYAPGEWYDRYVGVAELMPLARAVSAKSFDFDDDGNETTIDYARMMRIVLAAGYRGWIGVEYEGDRLSEEAGIRATRALLERIREERP